MSRGSLWPLMYRWEGTETRWAVEGWTRWRAVTWAGFGEFAVVDEGART